MAGSRTVQLRACKNGDIEIIVDGERTLAIHDNQTNDRDIFDSLKYEPGFTYERLDDFPDSNVNESVFRTVGALFDSIVKGINDINNANDTLHDTESEVVVDDQ